MSSIGELYSRFRQLINEGAKFLVIGAIGAIITFGVANAMRPIGEYKAITVATILATVITYLGNRYWSFRHRQGKGTTRDSILFLFFNGVGLVIYYACIGLIDLAGLRHDVLWYNIALVVGTGLGTLFRFWSYRKWIWLARPQAPVVPGDDRTESMAAMIGAAPAYSRSVGAGANGTASGASANGASANDGPRSHARPGRPTFRHSPVDRPSGPDGQGRPASHRRT